MSQLKHALSFLKRSMVRGTAQLGIARPLVAKMLKDIQEVSVPGVSGSQESRYTLFALNHGRFRGDLEALESTGFFRVVYLPFSWQSRLFSTYYDGHYDKTLEVLRSDKNRQLARAQIQYRKFLRRILESLLNKLGVDALLSAAIHYPTDLDWGAVADSLGVPWIVLHRENFVMAPAQRQHFRTYPSGFTGFEGSKIFLHNQIVQDLFVESGFVDRRRTSALGCLRMDEYVARLKRVGRPECVEKHNRVTLFSFHHGTGLVGLAANPHRGFRGVWSVREGVGLVRLFNEVHYRFALLAKQRPDIEFVIKPKWFEDWEAKIREAIAEKGLNSDTLSNLRIVGDVPAQDLILESDVVCGFGSTTLLEAAIAGKPVIMPRFEEAASKEYADYIHFADAEDIIDICDSPEAFEQMIQKRLEHPFVSDEIMEKRNQYFGKYVSPVEGGAVEAYRDQIIEIINARRTGVHPELPAA